MSDYPIADFDRFRFLRDSRNQFVSFDAQSFGEQLFAVVDCEFFRLARLHIHDGAALKGDWLEAFEQEMELLAEIEEPAVSRPFTWGRDDDELFYVNGFHDGEPLPDYLTRTGALSPRLAAAWLLPFVELIERNKDAPMSILRFSNRNLQVVRNPDTNRPELYFTEFTAWTKPGNLVVERGPEYFLAQSFCSMISGIPIRDFTESTLPRQFDYLPEDSQQAVVRTFTGKPGFGKAAFFYEIRKLAKGEGAEEDAFDAPQPRSPLRGWLRSEFSNISQFENLPQLDEKSEAESHLSYATEVEVAGLPCLMQLYPGTATIPREGWLEQHWISLRRPGRTFVNQLAVHDVDEGESITVITEEDPSGIDLRRLIRETGPLSLEHTVAMTRKLSASLDGLESSPSAVPVWFLPEENVYLSLGTTGTRDAADFKSAIAAEGPEFWDRVPFRLRLHQNMLGLLSGISFPQSLRGNAFEMAKENPHIRRTTVLLPLIVLALTGKRFDWRREVVLDEDEAPEGLEEFLNQNREQLLDKPHLLPVGFLKRVGEFLGPDDPDAQWDHDAFEREFGEEDEASEGAAELEVETVNEEQGYELTEGEQKDSAEPEPIADSGSAIRVVSTGLASRKLKEKSKREHDQFKEVISGKLSGESIDLSPRKLKGKPKAKPGPVAPPRPKTQPIKVSAKPKLGKASKAVAKTADESGESSARKVPFLQPTPIPRDPAPVRPVKNPIAEATEKASKEKRASPAPTKKKARRPFPKAASREEKKPPRLDPKVVTPIDKTRGLGWVWIVLAGLILGGGVGFYLHGKVKHAGLYEVAGGVEFPVTEYNQVSPHVNPFTDEIDLLGVPTSPPPIAVASDVTNLASAIERSKHAADEKKYSEAVDLALWGLQLKPSSAKAEAQLESALTAWIESGIDAPAKTMDRAAVSVLSEYYIQNRPSEGLYILFASAKNGNEEAMRILGVLFGQGRFVPRSASVAKRWLRDASELGDRDAQFYYGESSIFGSLVDLNPEGFKFLQQAAEAGHARALLFRGICSLKGLAMEEDVRSGFLDSKRAAQKGLLEAVYQMGLCQANGIGIEPSPESAAGAFKSAAELGYVPAMFRHGQCLILGFGTPQSYADGMAWMKKAAAAGHFDAQNWCSQHQAEFEPVSGL